jgi:Anti-sigma-K factor rskA, C-terminal
MNEDQRNAEYLESGPTTGARAGVDTDTAAELDSLREQLAAPATWAEPPEGLRDAVVAAVASASAEAPPYARERKSSRARWLVAAAAAVLIVAGAGALIATRDNGGADAVAVAGTDLAPRAHGEVTLEETGSGLSISLRITDLPPAPAGAYYQAWMKGEKGSVPIGTFHAHMEDGAIELWSGVDRRDYPTLTVTLQQEGAGPQSSGQVVLTADLAQ